MSLCVLLVASDIYIAYRCSNSTLVTTIARVRYSLLPFVKPQCAVCVHLAALIASVRTVKASHYKHRHSVSASSYSVTAEALSELK
eukprot:16117-Heterococcus_DN1.PRE.2